MLGRIRREAAEYNAADSAAGIRFFQYRRYRDPGRAVGGEAIDAGGNRRKGDGVEFMSAGERERIAIAAREQRILFCLAAVPDGADGVTWRAASL